MKLNTTPHRCKCEMTDACTRDAVGTVRDPLPRSLGDVQTCEQHADGNVIWYFGKRSPYAENPAPPMSHRD